MKSQTVRLVDVFLLGPFMMWAAGQRTVPTWARDALWWSGLLTVIYNGRNYLLEMERAGKAPGPTPLP